MAISSLGVGSGLELGKLVDDLLSAERAPMENRLNRSESRAQTQLSAFGTLKSALSDLNTKLEALSGSTTALKASSSAPETVTASAGETADPGRYQVQVAQLATAQSLASETFDDVDSPLGEGGLTLTVGEQVVELDLTAESSTLSGVRDAINAADAGVNAVTVRDGDAYRLLLTSAESGVAQQMTLTVDGTLDTRLASAQMTETQAASDAAFSVNGLDLTASGNVVDDVIDGVTLSLMQLTEGTDSVEVTIEPDHENVQSKLGAAVAAYNTLVGKLGQLGDYDAQSQQGGPLVGDATLRSLESRLSGVFSAAVDSGLEDNPFGRLLDIGIETDAQGKASLDAERLAEALAEDEAGVESLVSAFATGLGETLGTYVGSNGILDARTEGLDSELEGIADRRQALDRRMEQVEERLRAQFSALDTMLAEFQSTSDFLTRQLAGLSGA